MHYYETLNQLMSQDPGHRGLLAALPKPPLEAVSQSLCQAKRVILVTGFPVSLSQGDYVGETDGPSGTANLAAALNTLGCQVFVVTDQASYSLLSAALSYRAPQSTLIRMPVHAAKSFARQLTDRINPTHLITLERPGKARDGHFHNMRGETIDHMVADTDEFLIYCKLLDIPTISVGDGGNELGMGTFRHQIEAYVPAGDTICAHLTADYTLAAGVSNWWGWGIASLLSVATNQWLLPSPEQETRLLSAVLQAGAVDGCTKQAEMTVDRLPLATHLALLNDVIQLTAHHMKLTHIPSSSQDLYPHMCEVPQPCGVSI